MRNATVTITVLCLLTLIGVAHRAAAQNRTEPEERPFPGLFGHTGRATLETSFATFGGYDHFAERLISGADLATQSDDGRYTGGVARLTFMRPMGRYSLQAGGSSEFDYFPKHGELTDLTAQTSGAGLTIGRPLGRRGALRLSQTVSAASFYQFNPFAGYAPQSAEELALPHRDFQIQRGRTYGYDLAAGTDWRTSARDTLSLNYTLRHVRLPGEQLSLSTYSSGIRLDHRATRTVSFILGYSYELASRIETGSLGYHRIDSGVQYNSYIFSRHTTVSASTGAAVLATRDAAGAVSHVADVVVNAAIRHVVTRSLSAALEYRREPRIVDIYTNPTYADSVFFSLNERLARRLNVSLTTGISQARLDGGRGGTAYRTAFASPRANWLLARRLSVYTEYSYYGFHTSANLVTSPLVRRIDRQAVRAGLTWSLPLLTPGVGQ